MTYLRKAAGEQKELEVRYAEAKKTCNPSRRAIVFYRSKTWEHQYFLGNELFPTLYPERKKGQCGYKKFVAEKWQARAYRHRIELERFKRTNYGMARFIVYSTFPPSTAPAALSVVGCETGNTYDEWAHNTTTDVRGYFQVDSGNGGRVFYWRGKKLVLDSSRLYDPWYNTLVAVFMTSGGVDWREWHCQPFIGIG